MLHLSDTSVMGHLFVTKARVNNKLGYERPRVAHAVLVAVVWSLVVVQTQCKYVVEERTLKVLNPVSIEGQYGTAMSRFGRPAYAGSLLGALQVPARGESACKDFSTFAVSFKRVDSDYRQSPIALVESSGDCDFAWKVLNAQKAGAQAVLIVDKEDRPLGTFADSEAGATPRPGSYVDQITIPSALINKTVGDLLKSGLSGGSVVVSVKLEWTELPTDPVNYEIWTIGQDKCGSQCDTQVEFVQNFRAVAQNLEKGGYTVFSPHYILWFCPDKYIDSKECISQCINKGRYCSPDPEDDFYTGYEGRDVVLENLRQLCVHKLLVEQERSWIWWDYIADYEIRCSMKEGQYTPVCGNLVAKSLGLDTSEINNCMGDPEADEENEILKAEQDGQSDNGGERGDITITPTLVINNQQYTGKLENGAVLKTLCKEFVEGEEPSLCLHGSMETNECLTNNGGCWMHPDGLVSACRDTFKGRVCECPFYQGVQMEGDGYTFCEPVGPGRCSIDNAGCWKETRDNVTFSACSDARNKGCECPVGFRRGGLVDSDCGNIDECIEKTRCQCKECSCSDTWGSYDCTCSGDLIYLRENDACVRKTASSSSRIYWVSFGVLGFALLAITVAGFLVYKYQVREYMDSKIRTTLAQYMPLDSSNQDIYRHLQEDGA